jgi:hypothetical protein
MATAVLTSSPNLSPKSTLIVRDDHQLLFANIASPRTVANLRLDPRIEINCVEIFSRRGNRFTGHASVRSAGDPIAPVTTEEVAMTPIRISDAAFAAPRHHFDDRQIADLTAIIASMNSLNRMAISCQLEAPPSQVTDKI